ncbi:MAG TPA: hypothetical protein VK623_09400 [Flavobacterium sp.]|nr:hypothetical protein [Flavobacterium sp.]
MKYLDCSGNALTTLDVSMLDNLYILHCYDNQLANLAVHPHPNIPAGSMAGLTCSNNHLTSLTLASVQYELMDCSHNLLTSIDLSQTPYIYEADLNNNLMASFSLPANIGMGYLILSDNPLTDFEMTPHGFEYLYLDNTLLASVDLHNLGNTNYLSITGNPNLQVIA